MKPIDEVAEILKDQMFMVATNGENGKGMELRYKGGYLDRMAVFASVADSILSDYIPEQGYSVRHDLRFLLNKVIQLNGTEYKYQESYDRLKSVLMGNDKIS